MKRRIRGLTFGLVALMLSGCVLAPGPDYSEEVAPPLPAVVEFDSGPYYSYGHYHYWHDHDRWRYARERGGPWRDLPRSHWPREIRYRGAHGGAGGGEVWHGHDHGRGRGWR